MTNEEAIEILKGHIEHWEMLLWSKTCNREEGIETIEAFSRAVKALKELPKRRKEAKRWKAKYVQTMMEDKKDD